MATYIEQWQSALRKEIHYLKTFGNTRIKLTSGQLIYKGDSFRYYFETNYLTSRIPVGAGVTLQWGKLKIPGRMLSSEGKNVIVELEQELGDVLTDVILQYDPWELLDQLHERLETLKGNKTKRARITKLMKPTGESRHPQPKKKSTLHELALRSKYNPVTFVWGPPGTGKTYTLARVVANKYLKGKRVLVLSQSNQAVDVLMIEVFEFLEKAKKFKVGELVRYGSNTSDQLAMTPLTMTNLIEEEQPDLAAQKEALLNERKGIKTDLSHSFSKRDSNLLLEIETKLAQVNDKIRKKEVDIIKNAEVVGTTLAKAATDSTLYESEFDLVVIDEVSMAHIPQLGFAVSLAKKAILCGDFKQLPPIAHAKHPLVEEWLKVDIFNKVRVTERLPDGSLHPHLLLLNEQRRMHPDISSFTNKHIYDSLVGDHPSVLETRQKIADTAPFVRHAAILIDTSQSGAYCFRSQSGSRANLWHLLISFQLIHEAVIAGATTIGYTTPYRLQAEWMEVVLSELYEEQLNNGRISTATVHRFQGSEKDMMVFDTVDSYPENRASMLLVGKESERLINVAITRSRGKFIHVANVKFVRDVVYHSKVLRKLVEHQIANKQRISHSQIGKWVRNQHPNISWMHAMKLETLIADINHCKSWKVFIPPGTNPSSQWELLLKKVNKSPMMVDSGSQDVLFPFHIIDEQILWIGVPFDIQVYAEPPYVSVRAQSRGLCKLVQDQLIKK